MAETIIWSREAIDTLRAARAWIAEHDPAAARRVASRVRDAADGLSAFPHRGRPASAPGLRELVVAGTPFILLYAVDEVGVHILGVWHHARLR